MKIGIALSGGGARGIAHIGVLKALDEMGIRIDAIAGTSAGSIVAALYAKGLAPDRIFEVVSELSLFKAVRPAWAWSGLFTMDGLRQLLLKYIPSNNFSELGIPCTVAATEIRLGEVHYFSSGELVPTVVASCSVPGVFNPVQFNDHLYVDGGLLDNLPVKPLRSQVDFIIGSHCNHLSPQYNEKSFRAVVERSLLLAIGANTRDAKMQCDVFIEPTHLGRFTGFDIAHAKEIFDTGYQFTKENFMPHHFQKKHVA